MTGGSANQVSQPSVPMPRTDDIAKRTCARLVPRVVPKPNCRVGGASLLGFPRSVAIKEQDYAGHFAYLLVSDDPTSPTYIRKPGNRIVSVVVLWNTGKDKGTFYSTRIFAVFFILHLMTMFF
jgi:hypothetical protein